MQWSKYCAEIWRPHRCYISSDHYPQGAHHTVGKMTHTYTHTQRDTQIGIKKASVKYQIADKAHMNYENSEERVSGQREAMIYR